MTHSSLDERLLVSIVLTLLSGCNTILDNPRGNLVKDETTENSQSGGAVHTMTGGTRSVTIARSGSGGEPSLSTPVGGSTTSFVLTGGTTGVLFNEGNQVKNSNAQGGSAQGGSAQGGNAQVGSAQGGSAQGGSAQGGSAQGGSAQGGSAQGGCEIGETLYANGSVNPENHCMVCDPARSTSKWVLLAEGARCDPGKVCSSNSCVKGCWINSKYVEDGAANLDNPCESCKASLLSTGWSKEPTANCVSAISAGPSHSCAVVGGKAYCWGSNTSSQLGNAAATTRSTTPVLVDGLVSGVTAISSGSYHTCAIVHGGAKCWGTDHYGSLGTGHDLSEPVGPTQVEGLADAVSVISASNFHTCAVVDRSVKCWGDNSLGQLGNDITNSSRVPLQVSGLVNVATDVVAGFNTNGGESFSCAVFGGAVMCWGSGDSGQLGTGVSQRSKVPVPAKDVTVGVTSVTLGWTHGCALVIGDVYCWGFNRVGQVGVPQSSSLFNPVKVDGLPGAAIAVSVNHNYSCAIANGDVYCWGACNNNLHPEIPLRVKGLPSGVTAISSGANHTCAISNGSAYCWGENSSGQLGIGSYEASSDPVKLSFF